MKERFVESAVDPYRNMHIAQYRICVGPVSQSYNYILTRGRVSNRYPIGASKLKGDEFQDLIALPIGPLGEWHAYYLVDGL